MGRPSVLMRTLKFVAIAQTVVFLAITITWAIKRHNNTANLVTKICSECTDLLTRGEMIEDKIPESVESLISEENNKMCCGDVKNMAKLALRKIVIDLFKENKIGKIPVEVLCQPKDPLGIPQGRIADCEWHRLLWNKNDHTRTSGGLQHLDLDGEVYICKAGTYFVHIAFFLGVFKHFQNSVIQ